MRNRFNFLTIVLAATMAATLIGWGVSRRLAAQDYGTPPPPPAGDGPALAAPEGQAPAAGQTAPEILTRGPIHEAFAEVVNYNPQAGQAVTKQPPAPIEEMPPTEKPAGDYIWVPGYWSWDQDRDQGRGDYIWISGVWRMPPPGTTWVPGYWSQPAATSYQWVSGYWGPATVANNRPTVETEYLPAPPQSLEQGPNMAPPSEDYFWIPGCWRWRGDLNRYIWLPGHWGRAMADWIWIPDHYICTPAGYVFVPGHWDYLLDRRGIAFCPVYYANPYFLPRGYYYSPTICIDAGIMHGYLFCRPAYGHYYFGDYYDPGYARLGFYPGFGVDIRIGYDPLYAHDRWYYRHDPMWERHMHEDYAYRREHIGARPPHTYAAAVGWNGGGLRVSFSLGTPMSHVAARGGFERVSPERRQQYVREQHEVRAVQAERRNAEVRAHNENGGRPPTRPVHTSMASAAGTTSRQVGTQSKGAATTAGGRTGTAPAGTAGRPAATTTRPATSKPAPARGTNTKDKDKKN